MNKINWVSVEEREPEKDGVYFVTTINLKSGERLVKRSGYTNGHWVVNNVAAWMPEITVEPYMGETKLDEKVNAARMSADKLWERRRASFELKTRGLTWTEIGRRLGTDCATAQRDVSVYLELGRPKRRKCTFDEWQSSIKKGSCLNCKRAVKTDGREGVSLFCPTLNMNVYKWDRCEFHEKVDLVYCEDCVHCKNKNIYGDTLGFLRYVKCEVQGRWDACDTCSLAEKKAE